MSAAFNLSFLPSFPKTKVEYLAQREAHAIFSAAVAYAEPELARLAAIDKARRAAKRAYDTAVLFLVWPDGLCPYKMDDGRTVYAPWHKFIGPRRHRPTLWCPTGWCEDWEPAPEGAVYMTAEELGFNNAELRAHAHNIALCSDTIYWIGRGGAPRELRSRIHRVNKAIAGQIAAWHRRRALLAAWKRTN
jgi:hypothetical protein